MDFGSIAHALRQPDGAKVSIYTAEVTSVPENASAFCIVIRDPILTWVQVPVFCDALPDLRPGRTVDVEGVITTLRTGERAILAEKIGFYLDDKGRVCSLPPVGHTVDISAWPWKSSIDVDSASTGASTLSALNSPRNRPGMPFPSGGSVRSVLLDPPSGEFPSGNNCPEPSAHLIAKAKMPETPTVSLPNKVVTVGTGKLVGCIYIEEPDRSCGIRVATSGTFSAGDVVSVSGVTATTSDHERFIVNATITKTGAQEPLKPLGMLGRDLGGRDFACSTVQRGVLDGMSQNNIGLLVKIWGKVTERCPAEKCFYIDDGWGLNDGTGHSTGVRVSYAEQAVSAGNPEVVPPEVGWYVSVTGISGVKCIANCESGEPTLIRVLKIGSRGDVIVHDPEGVYDWPMFMHDIAHTGVSYCPLPATLQKKWHKDLAGSTNGVGRRRWLQMGQCMSARTPVCCMRSTRRQGIR